MFIDLKYSLKTWMSFLSRSTGHKKPKQNYSQVLDSAVVYSKVNEIIHLSNNTKAIVITPTTGRAYLQKAIESVQKQDYPSIRHLIAVDGAEFWEAAVATVQRFDTKNIDTLLLPHNTGKNGMNGHRIYAALSFLVNATYVFFLDEDNWYEPNHISSMIEAMEKEDLEWVFAMRKIHTENGAFVVNDECESIGDYPCYSKLPHLIDTNCYGFRRSALAKSAHHWYHPLRADRYFFHHLKQASPKFKSTGLFTVNYRLTEGRVPSPEFFIHGNKWMENKYGGRLPWKTN